MREHRQERKQEELPLNRTRHIAAESLHTDVASNDHTEEKELDLSAYSVRTDLALESHQMALEEENRKRGAIDNQQDNLLDEKAPQQQGIPGIHVQEEREDGIEIVKIEIETEEAAKQVNKRPGLYLTLEAKGLRQKDSDFQDRVTTSLANHFHSFLEEAGIGADDKCLVVGLGNWNVTPDALGPIVVGNTMVTKHLFDLQPEQVEEGFRSVSAVSPGVLGTTGIETSHIVKGIVSQSEPDFVIAIDSLASRSIERLNTTIQISDTGIDPGSGVGNKRLGLNKDTLGIPVIAIGVPTVVDAVSIVSDSIDFVLGHLGQRMKEEQEGTNARRALAPASMNFNFQEPEKFDPETIPDKHTRQAIMGMVGTLEDDEKRQLIREVLLPLGNQLIVTPKEVDDFIEDIGNVIANGLNAALHEKIDMSNVSAYTH